MISLMKIGYQKPHSSTSSLQSSSMIFSTLGNKHSSLSSFFNHSHLFPSFLFVITDLPPYHFCNLLNSYLLLDIIFHSLFFPFFSLYCSSLSSLLRAQYCFLSIHCSFLFGGLLIRFLLDSADCFPYNLENNLLFQLLFCSFLSAALTLTNPFLFLFLFSLFFL